MHKIFTAGYSGRSPKQLQVAAEKLGAIVVDIRHVPASRQPGWGKSELFQMLKSRYVHLTCWGNLNYRSGGIRLVDADMGLRHIMEMAQYDPLILLCGCGDYSGCHRRTCAEMLHSQGIETQELEWPEVASPSGRVKAISLHQPWASLIAIGAKKIETRHWSTAYRGPLLIHAAKTMTGIKDLIDELPPDADHLPYPFHEAFRGGPYKVIGDLPFGALVGIVDLVNCVRTELLAETVDGWERAFGNYEPHRFGWVLRNAHRFPTPLPYRGQQGFFDAEIDLESALKGDVQP